MTVAEQHTEDMANIAAAQAIANAASIAGEAGLNAGQVMLAVTDKICGLIEKCETPEELLELTAALSRRP